jgi:hypothetical protein
MFLRTFGSRRPPTNIMKTDRPLELLHMDLFGPIAYISIGGSKYCQAKNEFGLRIKKIRSDNGTEFKNSQIEGFLEEEGIKHEFFLPTPHNKMV